MSQRTYLVSQHLIANNVEQIAALSWQGYQSKGRGVVLIESQGVDDPTATVGPLVYLSDQEVQTAEAGWPARLTDLVQVYNPDSEVIVVVRWRDQVGIYRFKSPVAPQTAYERLGL